MPFAVATCDPIVARWVRGRGARDGKLTSDLCTLNTNSGVKERWEAMEGC